MKGAFATSAADATDLARWRTLLERSDHRPLAYLGEERASAVVATTLHTLAEAESRVVILSSGGADAGLGVLSDLPWDTGVIGSKVGAFTGFLATDLGDRRAEAAHHLVGAVLERAGAEGFECLVCKVAAADVAFAHALGRHGFELMDTLLEFVFDFRRTPIDGVAAPEPHAGIAVRPAQPEDLDALVDLARRAFSGYFGRFHADPRIGRDKATAVYQEWVRSAAAGWADWIDVAETPSGPAGFCAWKAPTALEAENGLPLGHLSLVAVDPDHTRRGIFRRLAYAGMLRFAGSVDVVEAPTHVSNHAAQRGYAGLGWSIGGARHSFHRWL